VPTALTILASVEPTDLGRDLLVILAAAAIVAQVFRRLRLATIPGYLVAGFLAGPVFGLVQDSANIAEISGLATIILMFTIGLHLDVTILRRGMLPILGLGLVSTVLVSLATWPVGMSAGQSAPAALAVALAFSMSSTAVVMRILQDRRELDRVHGRVCFGVAIVQDLLAVVILAGMPILARWAGVHAPAAPKDAPDGLPGWLEILVRVALSIGGVTGLFLLGRFFLPRLLQEVAKGSSAELVLIVASVTAIGSAIAAQALGLSPEMGAFLAGFLLASTPFKHHLSGQMSPIRDLLLAVFFTSIGLKIMPDAIVQAWPAVLAGFIVLVALKGVMITASAWAFGSSASSAVLAGVYLAQGGEFSLVVLGQGRAVGLFTDEGMAALVAMIVLSLIATPLLITPGHRLARAAAGLRPAPWIRRSALRERAHDDTGPEILPESAGKQVIVAGFGPVGRALVERLTKAGIGVTIVELNPKTIRRQAGLGRRVVFGDITNAEVLESAGVRDAEAVVLTMPDEDAALKACPVIRTLNPGALIAARANYLSRAIMLQDAGADHVVVEEIATAQAMEKEVIARLQRRIERSAREAAARQDPSPPSSSPPSPSAS
jgi:CPA2 family monovalent cation:H+ antiporter-2